jgi:hypothetical protein
VNTRDKQSSLVRDPKCRALVCDSCCGPKLWRQYLWNWPEVYWSIRMAEKKRISYLRKLAADSGNGQIAVLAAPPELVLVYPAISEYLTSLAFPDGSERETSTITLLIEDGKIKAALNDRANSRSIWRSGDTVEEVLACLEAAVADERSSWRRWLAKKPGNQPKK